MLLNVFDTGHPFGMLICHSSKQGICWPLMHHETSKISEYICRPPLFFLFFLFSYFQYITIRIPFKLKFMTNQSLHYKHYQKYSINGEILHPHGIIFRLLKLWSIFQIIWILFITYRRYIQVIRDRNSKQIRRLKSQILVHIHTLEIKTKKKTL